MTSWQKLDAASNWAQYTIRQLAVERNSSGRLEIFAVDAGGNIFHRSLVNSGGSLVWEDVWSDWVQISGSLRQSLLPNTSPHAASPGNLSTLLGTPVTVTLARDAGGVAPFAWTISGLPAGLSANGAGEISGVPVANGIPISTVNRDHHRRQPAVEQRLVHLDDPRHASQRA